MQAAASRGNLLKPLLQAKHHCVCARQNARFIGAASGWVSCVHVLLRPRRGALAGEPQHHAFESPALSEPVSVNGVFSVAGGGAFSSLLLLLLLGLGLPSEILQ